MVKYASLSLGLREAIFARALIVLAMSLCNARFIFGALTEQKKNIHFFFVHSTRNAREREKNDIAGNDLAFGRTR